MRLVCFRSGITASLREEYRIRQIYGSQKNLECNNDRKAYSTSLPTFQRNKGTAHSVQCVHAPCFLFAQCSTVQNIFSCPPHEKSNRTERQFISRPKRKRREQDRCNADIFTLFLKLSGKPIVPDSEGGKQPFPPLSILLSISHLSTVFLSFLSFSVPTVEKFLFSSSFFVRSGISNRFAFAPPKV